jgi:D-alanine-D-alanine ligase
MSKIKVGVLRGGISSEYDVSLKTGSSVLANLPKKYEPVDILISKDGTWHVAGLPISPYNIDSKVDVVFNALHGEYGEDGQVQKILDSIFVPYTGSGHFPSMVGMNKVYSKEILARHDIKVPRHIVVRWGEDPNWKAKEVFKSFCPPWIVKPVDGGSSVGVFLVKLLADLPAVIKEALEFSDTIMVEEYIRGTEATCGVVEGLRGKRIYSLLPVEIRKPIDKGFFDYESKYTGISQEICPGLFAENDKRELESLAARVHEVLGLSHYSRTDFIVTPRRGIYVLETNTLPGLTTESLLPKSLDAVGVSYPDFLDHVIQLALKQRH